MNVPRARNPRSVDDQLLQRLAQERQRREALAAQVSGRGDVAERFAALRRQYPWVPANATLSAALGGIDPDSPAAQALADGAARSKAKGGLGFDPVGTVTTPKPKPKPKPPKPERGGFMGLIDDNVRVVKSAVRGVTTATQSLYEEAQGAIRNVAAAGPGGAAAGGAAAGAAIGSILPGVGTAIGAVGGAVVGGGLGLLASSQVEGEGKWELQSTGGIALQRALRGEKVNLGAGWLPKPDEDLAGEQRRRAQRVSIDGHSLTPGRLMAAGVVEPGTDPYNVVSGLVDASIALSRYDPASALLNKAGQANRARRLLVDEAGAVDGVRKAVNATKAEQWWYSDKGRDLAVRLAENKSFDEVWKATGKKLDVRTVLDLVDADDVDKVDDILLPKLGVDIREKFGFRTQRLNKPRLMGAMPGEHLDIRDPNNAVEQLDRFQKNANLDPDIVARNNERLARALRNIDKGRGRPAAYDVLRDVMKDVNEKLLEGPAGGLMKGVAAERANEMTTMWIDRLDDIRHYALDEIGDEMRVPGVVVGGKRTSVAHPALFVQYLNGNVPLPDARDIRKATSILKPLVDSTGFKGAEAVGDFLVGQVWKRMALLRGAYTVRVVGEEQARMAATGLDSMFHHPLSFIAWRAGRDSDALGNNFDKVDEAVDELDQFNKALNREWGGWVDKSKINTKNVVRFAKDSPGFKSAWAGEILETRRDPVLRAIAQADNGLDDVKQAFWDGALKFAREDMAQDAKGLANRATADDYIDEMARLVTIRTGGDADLLEVIRSGNLEHILGTKAAISADVRPSKELLDVLDAYMPQAPDWVKGDQLVHAPKTGAAKVGGALDNVTKYLFSELMGERTNNLSRSPAFRQFYARRMEELLPRMDATAQTKTLEWARTNNLPKDTIKRMEGIAASASGDVALDHADTVAKGFALESTKDLLYDMTERGQMFDAARLVTPFGEAWKEVMTRWAKIGLDHPQVLARRLPQVIQGARGQGFFHENASGEEVFTYPGSEWLTEQTLGVPVPLTGRVAGLSLMTEVLPGIGPAVSVPAGWIIPDTPQYQEVRNVIFPFGEQDTTGGFLESFLPPWAQKMRQATGEPADARLFGNTVQDVARYLVSTGEYSANTPDDIIELMDAAKSKAKGLYAVRSAAQFFAPSAPSPEFLAQDKDGRSLVAMVMVQDFFDMQNDEEAGGYETAVERFLDKYGENAFLLMQGKTNAVVANAPVTTDGVEWEKRNPAIARRYANSFGFFAPAEEEFDFDAYSRSVESGKRQPLTPEQAVKLANARVASMLYDKAKDEIGDKPNQAARQWLRDYRAALREDYPGFDDRAGIAEKASLDTVIAELEDAATDNRLADNPLTAPLRKYLEARSYAQQDAEAAGLASFKDAAKAKPLREWLRELGEALAEEDSQFARVYESVFEREFPQEDED